METGVNRYEAAAGKTKKPYETTVPMAIGNTEILSTIIKKLRADC
jgi:hypothetical protein